MIMRRSSRDVACRNNKTMCLLWPRRPFFSLRSEALVKKPLGKFFSFSHVSVCKNGTFEREPVSNS